MKKEKSLAIRSKAAGRKTVFFFLFALCAAALASCRKDDGGGPVPVGRVVVAYLGGDNNLSSEVPQKIEALTAGLAAHGTHGDRLLIFHDAQRQEPALTEVYLDSRGAVRSQTVRTYDGSDSADGATMAAVCADARAMYPAARFGLVVFSHASGWLPEGMYLNPLLPVSPANAAGVVSAPGPAEPGSRSIFRDGNNEMEIAELADALPAGMFDWIVFETCFMAGVEVAYELRGKAPVILASSAEIVSPGFTEVYPRAMGYLLAGDIEGFARAAFEHADAQSGWRRSATCSVIRTAGLQPLKEFIAANADFGVEVDVFDVQRFDRNAYRLFFDLEDYCGRLLPTDALRAELARLIAGCVVWKAATPEFMTGHGGFAIERHSGLTSYIPQPEFERLNQEYMKLKWNK